MHLICRSVLALGLLIVLGATAQAQQPCPQPTSAKLVPGNSYTISVNDRCWWVMFTAVGPITVTLPAPGLLFSPGFSTTVLPLSGGVITFNQTPDDSGKFHQINGGLGLSLAANQGASLQIEQDSNWYALPSGGGPPLFSASAYGAVCDGTADVTAGLRAAISAAQAAGGGLIGISPSKPCLISQTLAITTSSVGFSCLTLSDRVAGGNGCELKWVGAAGGRMMSIVAPFGTTSNLRLQGNVVRGIRFNGNNGLAADGLYTASLYGFVFEDLTFMGGFSGGNIVNFEVDHAINGVSFGDPPDTQKGYSARWRILNAGFTSVPLRLGNFIDGTGSHGNASYNYFTDIAITGNGSVAGILCVGCDNNDFDSTNVAGTSLSVDMTIAVSGAALFPANGNIFRHYLGSGSFLARGQDSFPTCVGFAYPPAGTTCTYANILHDVDRTNGSVNPTIETGAQLSWIDDLGVGIYGAFFGTDGLRPGLVVGDDVGGYNICNQAALTNSAANNSAYICNGSTGDLFHFDNGAASRFGLYLDTSSAAANLAFRRHAGTGAYVFHDAPITSPAYMVSQLPTCNSAAKGGVILNVSDLTTPTYNATAVGGGGVQGMVQCDGTNWKTH